MSDVNGVNGVSEVIEKFNHWWALALKDSPLNQKSAVCISTIDQQGFPDSRFVDLKSADEQGFVFCTYLDSNKGKALHDNPKIAMAIWWDHIGRQVRVNGIASPLDQATADKVWMTRSTEAQLTTVCAKQSAVLADEAQLIEQLELAKQRYQNKAIPRPANWGGYRIKPNKIEFFRFKPSRLHIRELYQRVNGVWQKQLLQP